METETIERLLVVADAMKMQGNFIEMVESIRELALVEWFVTIENNPDRSLNEQERERIRMMQADGLVVPYQASDLHLDQEPVQAQEIFILTDRGQWWWQIIKGSTHPEPAVPPVTWRVDWKGRIELLKGFHPTGTKINGRNRCGTCERNISGLCARSIAPYRPEPQDYGCEMYIGPDVPMEFYGLVLT